MLTTAPHNEPYTATHAPASVLFLACARSAKPWTLGCTTGDGQQPRARRIAARHQARWLHAVAQAKRRCGRPATAPVVRGSAAGRAGCGRHRFVPAHGLTTSVVDASALAVKRRQRRAQSAGVDVRQFLTRLRRAHHGDRGVWPVGHGPSLEAEDQRPRHRALETVPQARASTPARLKG
jgi:transposase